jgi:D-alanine transaminase
MVTEATHSSLVWVRGGCVEATPEGVAILPGTTRARFARLAAELGLGFKEARIDVSALCRAEEVMMTGTTYEVMPIVAIDGAPIGAGDVGPIARRFQAAFRDAVAAWLRQPRDRSGT